MKTPLRSIALVALSVATLVLPPRAAHSGAMLHVAQHWTIGGDGGWDYLTADSASGHLFVSHGAAVEVLDMASGKRIGRVEPTPGVHGIAIAPELGRGYVSCGRDSSIVVFDVKTFAVVQRVVLPARNPDAIVYEPVSRRVLTFNGGSSNACVVDAASGRLLDTLSLAGRPEFAVADGRGRVFANIEDRGELVEIDPVKPAVVRRWSLAPGVEPSGLAMDRAHRRLFSGCGNQKLVVSDADGARVITTLPIGEGVDACGYDARRHVAIASNGDGTLTVVREESPEYFHLAETDTTQRGARTMALDPSTSRVFVVTAQFGPPPAPTADRPRPRASILPGTFEVIVLEP